MAGKSSFAFNPFSIEAKPPYLEVCLFALDNAGLIRFNSLTSKGQRSEGWLGAAPDIHPQAICLHAEMDAGHAGQIHWPDAATGFHWAVDSPTKTGWNRLTQHHYLPV